jgi:hypothetical protein
MKTYCNDRIIASRRAVWKADYGKGPGPVPRGVITRRQPGSVLVKIEPGIPRATAPIPTRGSTRGSCSSSPLSPECGPALSLHKLHSGELRRTTLSRARRGARRANLSVRRPVSPIASACGLRLHDDERARRRHRLTVQDDVEPAPVAPVISDELLDGTAVRAEANAVQYKDRRAARHL